jgi:hypothetical protein
MVFLHLYLFLFGIDNFDHDGLLGFAIEVPSRGLPCKAFELGRD